MCNLDNYVNQFPLIYTAGYLKIIIMDTLDRVNFPNVWTGFAVVDAVVVAQFADTLQLISAISSMCSPSFPCAVAVFMKSSKILTKMPLESVASCSHCTIPNF